MGTETGTSTGANGGFISCEMMSMGTGKMMVLLFSAEIEFRVWRYLSWGKVG